MSIRCLCTHHLSQHVSKNSGSSEEQMSIWMVRKYSSCFKRMHVNIITVDYCFVIELNYTLWYCMPYRSLLHCMFVEKNTVFDFLQVILKASCRSCTKTPFQETSDSNSFSGKTKLFQILTWLTVGLSDVPFIRVNVVEELIHKTVFLPGGLSGTTET